MLYMFVIAAIQIVAESFPISSSGNCTLYTHILNLYTTIKTFPIPTTIDFLLHGATLLIIAIYFRRDCIYYVRHVQHYYKKMISVALSIVIANVITVIGYYGIRSCELITLSLSHGLYITAGILALLWRIEQHEGYRTYITVRDGVIIGLIQMLSLLPGISRFASTYTVGRVRGLTRNTAFAYSFILEVPLIGAAFLKGWYEYVTSYELYALYTTVMMGTVVVGASIVSYYCFIWSARLASTGRLYHFFWYVFTTACIALYHGW